jgi:Tfp pilus assembly protein PilF
MVSLMPQDANIGMGYLEEALKLDPNYAVAHAYMAWAWKCALCAEA